MMNRRNFLQTASAAAVGATCAAAPERRPNIVIMMADDMGFSDLGCYGSEIATPNLDALAGNGVRFTRFYNTARCCPTRASLLSGLYSHQAGIGHMVNNMGTPAYQGYLNDRCVTIAEVMRASGYRTAMSGKWHVGENRPHWPTDRGFERYFGLISGASSYWELDKGRQMAYNDKPYTPPSDGSFYMTDAFVDHATEFIGELGRGEQPFFLYLPFTSPHWPLHAHESDVAKYEGKYMIGWDELRRRRHRRMIEMGIVDKRWPMTERDEESPAWETVKDKKDRDRAMAVYAAQIDRMDQGVGRVVAKLREMGTLDNTLLLFLADNGGCAEKRDSGKPGVPPGGPDSYLAYGLPWANASNTPFRRYKHWVHEGGISSPLIAHWPAGIARKGAITHESGHLIDLMSTCVDVGKAKYPSTYQGRAVTPMEGTSLQPAFQGKRLPQRKLFWEHEGNRAVRDGKWKLVSRYPGNWELYDLEADRTEVNDLAGTQANRVKSMTSAYDAWASRCGVVPWGQLTRERKAAQKKA
ncbi:MAG: arylsulfatase [Bryobacteraceae bacterium]